MLRKIATKGFRQIAGDAWISDQLYRIMAVTWLSVGVHCEKGFKRIKGYRDIGQIVMNIQAGEDWDISMPMAA